MSVSKKPDGNPYSVKYLTCWYWANEQCKKPEWECAYSHHHTGIPAKAPVARGPGLPMVAGNNAAREEAEFVNPNAVNDGPGSEASFPGASFSHSRHSSLPSALPSSRTGTRSHANRIDNADKDEQIAALKRIIAHQGGLLGRLENTVVHFLKDGEVDINALRTLFGQAKAGEASLNQIVHLVGQISRRTEARRLASWDAVNKFQNERKSLKRVVAEEGFDLEI